ncbi:MAG: hypothetical protein AAGA54_17690 [Myxococcota bacterium]
MPSKKELAPINPKRKVSFQAEGDQLAVSVKLSPKAGGFVISSKPGKVKNVGVDAEGGALNLAVTASGGSVSIAGLDGVLNRASGDSRCWLTVEEANINVKSKAF